MHDELVLRFFRDDIGGILINDEAGTVLYEDEKAAAIRNGSTNWQAARPPAVPGQKGEIWDLLDAESGKTFMAVSSTYEDGGGLKQIHHVRDLSPYMGLYRDITDYSRMLKDEKDHDGMTWLYNKGKFLEWKRTMFLNLDTIAVFYMDVNGLKHMNDTLGHEAGDLLIKKAAESLKRIEKRNILPFRMGGDEFAVVALHVSREKAEEIRKDWEEGLAELNRAEDGVPCVMACGYAFAEKGYDLDKVLALADERMYEDKRAKKLKAGEPLTR